VNVCRLRVVIAGISPLIWRRLEVAAGTTAAGLHTIVQTVFGWSGEHLHRFVIGGTEYGISYLGGPGFRDNARQVSLADLGLREGERFTYEYNFSAAWCVDLRAGQITGAQPGRAYPRCTGGRRAGPPEDWNGPWVFLERTQPHLVFGATVRAAEIIGPAARCRRTSRPGWRRRLSRGTGRAGAAAGPGAFRPPGLQSSSPPPRRGRADRR
jgi:hypothetical protein